MAIVGRGDIASILNDRKGALFFASGVSNSRCADYDQFYREAELLLSQPSDLFLFYFSTISIYTHDSPYVRHKGRMEEWVRHLWKNYCIIRIGNITWGSNPHTFLNYLRVKKYLKQPYELRDEWKFMLDKEQLLLITDNIPLVGKHEINIFGRMQKPKDLI